MVKVSGEIFGNIGGIRMSVNTTDLRVVRSKQAIRVALVELIEEKGFEAVAVKDITTWAGINRGTFYAHSSCFYTRDNGKL